MHTVVMRNVTETAVPFASVGPIGRYRVRDLLRVPSVLSLSRLPLAVVFPFVLGRPLAALAVLAAAGISDVLDGWYARRFKQVTPTGCAIDPVTDKVFVLTVAVTMVANDKLSAVAVLLLSTREIGELPLVLWLATNHLARRARAEQPAANVPGKIATCLQFSAVSSALFPGSYTGAWLAVAAVAGIFAAVTYWKRALAIARLRP